MAIGKEAILQLKKRQNFGV